MRKIVAIISLLLAGVALAGCGMVKQPTAPQGASSAGKSGSGGLKAVGACLTAHGANPDDLAQALSAASPLTSSQLAALRRAAPACASSMPAKLKARTQNLTTCLGDHHLTMKGTDPLDRLLSVDLTKSSVLSQISSCENAASAKAKK